MTEHILPAGYEWGAVSGDYRAILKDGRKVAQFGGVLARAIPAKDWPSEILYQIAKGERELARGLTR